MVTCLNKLLFFVSFPLLFFSFFFFFEDIVQVEEGVDSFSFGHVDFLFEIQEQLIIQLQTQPAFQAEIELWNPSNIELEYEYSLGFGPLSQAQNQTNLDEVECENKDDDDPTLTLLFFI